MSEQEHETAQSTTSSSSGPKRLFFALIVILAIALIGGVGQLAGTGWFGYRSWMYDPGELYVLNMGPEPIFASVDGLEPVEVESENAQRIDLVGGTSKLTITNKAGELIEQQDVTIDGSHALFKADEKTCLAVVEVGGYYNRQAPGKPVIRHKIKAPEKFYVPETRNVIWPRKDFPKKVSPGDGEPLWVEIVGCDLLDDDAFLESYLGFQLQQRFQQAKERGRM